MKDYSPLEKLFHENRHSEFIFVQPGGNHGDYLIYFGLEQLARRFNIQYQSLTVEEFLNLQVCPGKVVYLHGAGGFNRWCKGNSARVLLHALTSSASLVVQGPCTIDRDEEYLNSVLLAAMKQARTPELVFFAREATTYELCNTYLSESGAAFFLDNDTAFWADRASLVDLAGQSEPKYRLYALRVDNEVSGCEIHDFGRGVELDPAYFCASFEHWVRVHLHAKEIVTSRTHSSIIGAILNKPTILYPSKYHKNRSIWEYTLRDRGVLWGPDQDKKIRTASMLSSITPARIRDSYKLNWVQRWMKRVPMA